jgi:NDP-sugar pyrophosphorylase family protein
LQHHSESGAALTICAKDYNHRVPYGVINVQEDATIGLDEKPKQTFIVNAGIYCINLDVLSLIPKRRSLDFPEFVKILYKNGYSVSLYNFDGYWRDIGTIEDYSRANIELCNLQTRAD